MNVIHQHHIIPRHAGGSDDSSNLFPLSITQHALAHRNRSILTGDPKDWLAWKMLSGQWGKEEARRISWRIGYNNRDTSFFDDPEYRKKQSMIGIGRKIVNRKSPNISSDQRIEINQKIAIKAIGNKRGIGNKGNPGPRPKVECPHCHKIGGDGIMARFHFDNCKQREI